MKIYRASAGSGKTFHLTREYLRLVIKNPEDFRHILAVTFTNKATEEMKSRILTELHSLSTGKAGNHLDFLCKDLQMAPDEVAKNAGKALNLILFNYSSFSVSTIDKFFQQILRAFAWESGLFDSLSIELDHNLILDEAIQRLYTKLESSKRLKKWMLEFSNNQITKGSSWDIRKGIRELGQELFKEDFQLFAPVVYALAENETDLSNFLVELYKQINSFENELTDIGNKGIRMIQAAGLSVNDFSGKGKGFIRLFQNLVDERYDVTDTMRETASNPEKWYSKTAAPSIKAEITRAQENGLLDLFSKAIQFIDEGLPNYVTSHVILSNFYSLAILNELALSIREILREKQIFLISDTNRLINGLIDSGDSPFIFEKTGQRIRHMMIDEFQDTSVLQWNNFLPLVQNSLSEQNQVMVVGDVKQSIYRWRNGDWTILADKAGKQLAAFNPSLEHLTQNWRSRKEIIGFNSALFTFLPGLIEDFYLSETNVELQKGLSIREAYQDAAQHFPSVRNSADSGYVSFKRMPKTKKKEDHAALLPLLVKQVETLQDAGYKAGDISILTRTTAEGREVAAYFLEYRHALAADSRYVFDILSVDALELQSSGLINFIVDTLKFIVNPADLIARVAMLEYLCTLRQQDFQQVLESYRLDEFLQAFIPESVDEFIQSLQFMPIGELVAEIIRLFNLKQMEKEWLFVESFTDWLNDENQLQVLSIQDLLERWESKGKSVKIQMPAGSDAIRIMTIHKAKGMEFEAVLIPFCDWGLDHSSSHKEVMWCHSSQKPFDAIPVYPVVYSKQLLNSHFSSFYLQEKLQSFVDNLNVLYVAFTRAKSALIVWMPETTKESASQIASFIWPALQSPGFLEEFASAGLIPLQINENSFSLGVLKAPVVAPKEEVNHLKINDYQLEAYKPELLFQHSYKELFWNEETNSARDLGLVYHAVLSAVKYEEDFEKSVQQALSDGSMHVSEAAGFLELMKSRMENPQAKNWFSHAWSVRNETGILAVPGKVKIPDRLMFSPTETIVVDYKFGSPQAKYNRQIAEYKELLNEMKFPNVQAFIWYVNDNQIIEV
ncbi:MAG: UvrD-helicase domain-containing protein [Bacteroidales bacterium]|nr:UvrD-helicase domain-containing protein [Bacteroidales bacterium]